MTWPVPTGNRKGWPPVRELSNCLPLLSFADASYNQPVYWTTAIFPAVTAAPLPALSSIDCMELTPLAGATALGFAPQAAIRPTSAARPALRKDPMRDMHAILEDFRAAGVLVRCAHLSAGSARGRYPDCEAARDGRAYGAGPEGAGHGQADFGGKAQGAQPQCTDGVIDFVNYLQHPLHRPRVDERPSCRRASDHTCFRSHPCHGAWGCVGLCLHAAHSRPEPEG